MKYMFMPEERLFDFEDHIVSSYNTHAPVRKGINNFVFSKVLSPEEIAEDYLPTVLPPKKYYMPQHETLLEFDITDGKQNMHAFAEVEPMVLYGVRTCDLAGIQCLNLVFSDRPKDLHYLIRKSEIRLIGMECDSPCDEFSSCGLMNNYTPNGGYDLFLTKLDGFVMVHINTHEGHMMLEGLDFLERAGHVQIGALKDYRLSRMQRFSSDPDVELNSIPNIFSVTQNSPVWDEVGESCVSCANCTNVCPTCYCFDVTDEIDINMRTGRRMRIWDSCQNESFAKVAGGENFREERRERKRHRFNRKFKYPYDRYSRFFCTGCGRCSRTCMAGINLKDTISKLAKESKIR